MQDKFWTDELVKEFVQFTLNKTTSLNFDLEQFKSSKSPKKEWEVVEVVSVIGNLAEASIYSRTYLDLKMGTGEVKIHSVRRLSDQEVFSVGDWFAIFDRKDVIERFEYEAGRIKVIAKYNMFYADSECGMTMRKLPQPILTTVDGVEIRENEECWIVDKYYNLLPEPEKINEFKRNYFSNCFIFSTREVAEKYILDHAPKLSLNDVKETASATVKNYWLLMEALSIKVKQKLNQ